MTKRADVKSAILDLLDPWTLEQEPTCRVIEKRIRESTDVDASSRTVERALEDLIEAWRVVSTPRGYVCYRQTDLERCVACGRELEKRQGVRGRCGNQDCGQPQHEVRCQAGCGTVYPVAPWPFPPGLGGDEARKPDTIVAGELSWEARSKRPWELGNPDEGWACPGCGNVWVPERPWPFSDERLVPHDPGAVELLEESLPAHKC